MPTRTIRLGLPTFLEKLSKHNNFRQRRSHADFDAFFAKLPSIQGYQPAASRLTIADKREWMAAVNWMAYHGKNLEAYKALSGENIQLLLDMLNIVGQGDRDEIEAQLIHVITDRNSDDAADIGQLSADSSGTDAEQTRRRGARSRRPSRKGDQAGDARPKRKGTSRARSSSRPKDATEAPPSSRRDEGGNPASDESEDESWSSSSGDDSSQSDGEGGAGHRHRRRGSEDRGPRSSPERSEPEEDDELRTSRHADGRRRSSSGRPAAAADTEPEEDAHGSRARNSPQRRARFADEPEQGLIHEQRSRGRSADRRERREGSSGERARSNRTAPPRNVPRWRPAESDTDDQWSELSESDHELTRRSAARDTRSATSYSRSPERSRPRSESRTAQALSAKERDEVARFERRQHRKERRARDQHSSDSDQDDDLAPTRFLAMTHSEAPMIIQACGCAMCKVYDKIHALSAKHILRDVAACYTRFKKPLQTTRRDELREWAAMLFWCLHPLRSSSWSSAPRKERMYIAECLVTPPAWRAEQRLTYAEATVKTLRDETAVMMRHKEALVSDALGGGMAQETRVTPTRAGLRNAFLAKLSSLEFNPVEWLDASESKDLLSMRKLVSASGNSAVPSSTLVPYASAPWLQSLVWSSTRPMNYLQAGRMLSVALRTYSDAFTAQLEQMARKHRADLDDKLFAAIDAATQNRDIGRILVCSGAARQYAADILEGALVSATEWHRDYNIPESKAVLDGRTRQRAEFPLFFQAIQKSIETACATQATSEKKDTFTRGAWLGFFDGLRAGRHSAELLKVTMKRGRNPSGSTRHNPSSSERSGSSKSDSEDMSGGGDRKKRKKKKKQEGRDSTRAKGGSDGRDGSSARSSGPRCRFQVHFPCSKSILGPKLGVECSASGPCRHCQKSGHWSGECPLFWATKGMRLPGYRPSGSRVLGSWDGDKNPNKETTRHWVRFLQNKQHFPNGGVPAREPGAPSLDAFQAWIGKAAA